MSSFWHSQYILLAILSLIYGSIAISIEQLSLRTQGLRTPNGISTLTPRLSWRLTSTTRGDSQSAYQIQVASSRSLLTGTPDLWDSGKVSSSDVNALYSGKVLQSRNIGWWRVRAYDAAGSASPWSDVTTFELGLLNPTDWKGSWIANTNYKAGVNSLPMFAKEFTVDCPVTTARLYLLGLGLHAAQINGNDVTTNLLSPGYNTYSKTLAYDSFNVTSQLTQGINVLGVELGKGVYDAESSSGRYMKWTTAPQQLKVLAQLEFSCLNGTTLTIPSDQTWKSTLTGPRTEASWFGGEEYNATQVIPNWSAVSGNRTNWQGVNTTSSPGGSLVGPSGPGLAVVNIISPISVAARGSSYVYDFGVNFAGTYTFTVSGCAAGRRIVARPSENVTSAGLADQSTTGSPIFDGYTCRGGASETMAPKFVYHGFRYLQMDNLPVAPTVNNMKGNIIRQNVDAIGSLNTSSSLFNSIHKIIDRSVQSNSYSVLTDCPHREKLGWLEETHLVFDTVTRGYDIQAWSKDIVRTIADSQVSSSGLIPDIAPEFVVFSGGFRDDPNWGSAGVLLPLKIYQAYGDIEVLSTFYTTMQSYVGYLTSLSKGSYLLAYGLGDWVTFDSCTPTAVTASFGYQQVVNAMVAIATALGKTSDVTTYTALERNITDAFHKRFFNTTTNSYSCGSQAANAIALDMGAVPAVNQAAVVATLVNSLTSNGNHLTVGEIALPSLFRSLQSANRSDVLFDMMSLTTGISYGYQVANGATSLWERWNGIGGSLNHFMLGYADVWLSSLSGITQAATSIAWKTIDLVPIVVGDLTSAQASYRTPNGIVSASWSKSGSALVYDVVVPVGSTANVKLNGSSVTEGGAAPAGRSGVVSVTKSGAMTTIVVGSGTYSFVVSS